MEYTQQIINTKGVVLTRKAKGIMENCYKPISGYSGSNTKEEEEDKLRYI